MKRQRAQGWTAAALGVLLLSAACGDGGDQGASGGEEAKQKPAVTVGLVGARVGPVANAAVGLGEAIQDWFRYLNAEGGINGRKVNVLEIESEYQVPKGVEAYNRMKQQGAAVIIVEGTALSDALIPASTTDKIPIVFPGQGNASTVEGEKFPFAFPGAPTYPHQASAMVQWVMNDWKEKGKSGAPKIVCLAWEPPPGREYCAGVKKAAEQLKASFVREIVIPAKAADVKPQMLEAKAAAPDYVLHSTIFGSAVLTVKGLCQDLPGVPVLTWHWALTENEVQAAGPQCAEGLIGTSMSKLPATDPEPLKKLREANGGKVNPVALSNQLYGNGLVMANLVAEAIRQADKKAGDAKLDGTAVKAGFESIKDFSGGIICPTTITAKDHGGNRALNIYKYEGGSFKLLEDCVEGPVLEGVEPKVS